MDRRQFMGTMAAGAAGATLGTRAVAGGAGRPNIVLILADDMGFADLGCYGSEIGTPNLDRMAAEGMQFTQFYNCARCCPTRASLLTGLYPHQAGVGHMTDKRKPPAYQGYLNHHGVTIAEALKPAGYHTYMTGKWHVGLDEGMWPVDRGFDEYFGILVGSASYFHPAGLAKNHERVSPGDNFYTTDAFTDSALEMIKAGRAKDADPFFLYLAYNAPHWPLHAKEEDIAKYEDRYLSGWDKLRPERHARQKELRVVDPRWELSPRDRATPPWALLDPVRKRIMARKMAVYAAMVDCMDQNIGRLFAALTSMGIMDNTLVMFLSDNGASNEWTAFGMDYLPVRGGGAPTGKIGSPHSSASYGRGWSNVGNTPFRLHKHWTHEGGISAPLIARWPGVIKPGSLTGEVGHVMDLMATCVDVAGASYPKEYNGEAVTPCEGLSLRPVFAGAGRPGHEALYWEHEGNRAVRRGEWKIVSDYPGSWHLFNLAEDRTENHNLAQRDPERVAEMARLHQEWSDRVGVVKWHPLWGLAT